MRVVFMGSSEFSCECLRSLTTTSVHSICAVVTQPDKPRGRHLKPSPSPLKVLAMQMRIPVLAPSDVNAAEAEAAISSNNPDVIVVVAFGQILKNNILRIPPKGSINVHASLLPKYRGAAPIQWAILNGDKTTGVTIIEMNEKLDAGDILDWEEVAIEPEDTGGTLHDKLAKAGGALLVRVLGRIAEGSVEKRKQDDSLATWAPKLQKEDGKIDWRAPAEDIYLRIRAFTPWPGCFTTSSWDGFVKVSKARVEEGSGKPGEIIEIAREGPIVATGRRALILLEVQPEGKRRMDGASYIRGRDIQKGMILGG